MSITGQVLRVNRSLLENLFLQNIKVLQKLTAIDYDKNRIKTNINSDDK